MSKTLTEIAQQLKDADKKVQLIYAFNGTGKTRLSREFMALFAEDEEGADDAEHCARFIYYNAFTEDLFYWDNDLDGDASPKLKIQPNSFTDWILAERGQNKNITENLQRYTNNKNLTANFIEAEVIKTKNGKREKIKTYPEVIFSIDAGNSMQANGIKISRGEEHNFIWSVFFALLKEIVDILQEDNPQKRDDNQFDELEYVFIDDPVSSLDENHLIEQALDLAQLIKGSKFINGKGLKYIITTHNPLFYNVLFYEFTKAEKLMLHKNNDGSYDLYSRNNESPFAYHLHLKSELEKAIRSGDMHKYHFNFMRNLLEKTSTFFGLGSWKDLLQKILAEGDEENQYILRILDISSHSRHGSEETVALKEKDMQILSKLVGQLNAMFLVRMPENTNSIERT